MRTAGEYERAGVLRERYRHNRGWRCLECNCRVAYDRDLPYCGEHEPKGLSGNATVSRGALDISERMRSVRKDRGVTQSEVGAVTGLDPKVVSKIECGSRRASPEVVRSIANALGTTARELGGWA